MLKLTIAKWFTPNDVNIDKEWILPDIDVKFEKQDYTPVVWKEKEFVPYDRQLETAKKVLRSFIDNNTYQLSIDKFNTSIKK
jgi:C-terminal processing protease CtpA/Prc